MRRTATAVLCGAFLALGVSACNPEPMDPTAECSGTEEKPAGEPGSAEVLLTVGNARGTRLLTTVLYADGWVLTLAEEAPGAVDALTAPRMAPPQIGRASCRERVGSGGDGVAGEQKTSTQR